MRDAYRVQPGEAVGRLDGSSVVVRVGAPLPRVCVLCGGRKKLNDRELRFDQSSGGMVAGPIWLVAAVVVLREVHRELEKDVPPPAPLHYSACTPCELRARDARQLQPAIMIGGGVGVLGAMTAGLNGAPILGVLLLLVSAAGAWLAYQTLISGRRFSASLRDDGVALRGIHGDAVQALLAVRLPGTDA
jgi:hypothetical protein